MMRAMQLGGYKWKDATASFTLALALFLVANAAVLNGVIYLTAPERLKENALNHSWDLLHGRGSDDSWGAMKVALDYVEAPDTANPLYSEVFFNRQYRFQYPPSALFALAGMKQLAGPERVRTNEVEQFDFVPVNDLIGWAFVLATVLATAGLLELQLRKRYAADSAVLTAARVAIVAGLVITFYPIAKAYTLGQIQVWINGMFAVALLAWATGRKALSGTLVGLMCLIKPHYALFLPWAALRAEWRFLAVCAATVVLGLGASVLVYGLANHIDYLRVASFLSERGEAYYPNQSINGLLNRIMSIAEPTKYRNLEFLAGQFPPYNVWVYGTTLLTSVAFLAAALFPRASGDDPDRILDFCIIALSCTLASPIAWEHHYGILPPIFAVLVAAATRKLWVAGLAAAYAAASVYIPATMLLAPTPFNFLQSYLLFAALGVLALLYWRPWLDGPARTSAN